MDVRVNQWSENAWALDDRIEVETELLGQGQIGAEASGRDDLVERTKHHAIDARHRNSALRAVDRYGSEARHELDAAIGDSGLQPRAQLASCGERVGCAAPVHLSDVRTANRPRDTSRLCNVRERDEVQERVEGRMATPDYKYAPTRIALSIRAQGCGYAVRDQVSRLSLPVCRYPISAERIGGAPGS